MPSTHHVLVILVVLEAAKVVTVDLSAGNGTRVLVVVLGKALGIKVISWEIVDVPSAVCEAAKSPTIVSVGAKRVIVVLEVEGTLLALALLTFTSVTLEHAVFQGKRGVRLSETTVTESTAVVAVVVLGQQCLPALGG